MRRRRDQPALPGFGANALMGARAAVDSMAEAAKSRIGLDGLMSASAAGESVVRMKSGAPSDLVGLAMMKFGEKLTVQPGVYVKVRVGESHDEVFWIFKRGERPIEGAAILRLSAPLYREMEGLAAGDDVPFAVEGAGKRQSRRIIAVSHKPFGIGRASETSINEAGLLSQPAFGVGADVAVVSASAPMSPIEDEVKVDTTPDDVDLVGIVSSETVNSGADDRSDHRVGSAYARLSRDIETILRREMPMLGGDRLAKAVKNTVETMRDEARIELPERIAEVMISDAVATIIVRMVSERLDGMLEASEIEGAFYDWIEGRLPPCRIVGEVDDADWPDEATHKLERLGFKAYAIYDEITGRMTILQGSIIAKGLSVDSMAESYAEAFGIARDSSNGVVDKGAVLELRRALVVFSSTAAACVVVGRSVGCDLWRNRIGVAINGGGRRPKLDGGVSARFL